MVGAADSREYWDMIGRLLLMYGVQNDADKGLLCLQLSVIFKWKGFQLRI